MLVVHSTVIVIDYYVPDGIYRFPTPPGKSWIFFLENSRTWKLLENHFGPGKSWKLKLKVLENTGKISLKVMHFSSGSNGKCSNSVASSLC